MISVYTGNDFYCNIFLGKISLNLCLPTITQSNSIKKPKPLKRKITLSPVHQCKSEVNLDNIFLSAQSEECSKIITEKQKLFKKLNDMISMNDFKSAKQEYSQFILSWVILHLNNITKSEVASIFGSNDPNCQAYVDIVSKAEKFHGICKIGNEVKTIRTLPYYELVKEDERFRTSYEYKKK